MSPHINLLIAICVAILIALLFHPRRGLVWAWGRAKRVTQRVLLEDALKHIYDCDYTETRATLQSLAGALSVGADQAAELCQRLESLGLLTSGKPGLTLTSDGRSYALRVIRIHRLWEQYLADRTGIDKAEWHRRADEQEHLISVDQAEALAIQIGNPCFDPHGDPIPSPDGKVPARRGQSLNTIEVGQRARVVHVEDEPEAIYAQLRAAHIEPGTIIHVLDRSSDRIRIEFDAEEHILAPLVAENLSVELLPRDTADELPPQSKLSSLEIGRHATVVGISPACRGQQRRRLFDLGVVPGTTIHAELQGPGGDPTAYRIRGAVIALRKQQADLITVSS